MTKTPATSAVCCGATNAGEKGGMGHLRNAEAYVSPVVFAAWTSVDALAMA